MSAGPVKLAAVVRRLLEGVPTLEVDTNEWCYDGNELVFDGGVEVEVAVDERKEMWIVELEFLDDGASLHDAVSAVLGVPAARHGGVANWRVGDVTVVARGSHVEAFEYFERVGAGAR